jgi:hypothetical protein
MFYANNNEKKVKVKNKFLYFELIKKKKTEQINFGLNVVQLKYKLFCLERKKERKRKKKI